MLISLLFIESCGEDDDDDDDDESEHDMLLEPVSDEESQFGEADAEDMESVTMSEAPDSMKYDKEMDIEEERQALQNIKGTLSGLDFFPCYNV
jgi:hypothetical protein